MPVAQFDYDVWAARFGELAVSVPPTLAASLFDEAGLYLSNVENSPIQDVGVRRTILNLITAHLATIQTNSAAQQGLVGRIKSATEGSVTVTLDDLGTAVPAWWAQSQWGLAAWNLLAPLRGFQYVPGPGGYDQHPDFNNNYPQRGQVWL